jgi:uncharacterized protein
MTTTPGKPWRWPQIIGYTLLVAVVYVIAQTGAVIAAAVVYRLRDPHFDVVAWLARSAGDGVALSVATLASTLLTVPAVWLIARINEPDPWGFLGVRDVGARAIAIALGVMLAFIAISDPINVYLLDRPLVPSFMVDAYRSAWFPPFMFVAIAILAPVTEELAFRGFLFSALQSRGIRTRWVILITSLAFAAVHLQYDLHDMTLVLVMGVLFGMARARFNSVLPSMIMHMAANTVAFIETMVVAR